MGSLPRPLLALLAVTIVFFAAWTAVLKPRESGSQGATLTTTTLPHVVKAPPLAPKTPEEMHAQAVRQAQAAAKKAAAARAAAAAKQAAFERSVQHLDPAHRELAELTAALKANKVVALLFYNPAGADDRADSQELNAIPADGGQVVKLAVPISNIYLYSQVTAKVPVTGSPTLVVINSQHEASTVTGYADQLAYNQVVAGALAAG